MTYPTEWKQFYKWHQANGISALPAHFNLPELNRFAARYQLATNFRGLNLEGYKSDTGEAYSSVMRAFLAYSALEQLHKATTEKSKPYLNDRWAALATESSAELRRSKKILLFLQEKMRKPLKHHLQEFIDGKTDNSLYVASALRHAVAHGFMSVHSNGTSPKTASRFCDRISEMLIGIADKEFTLLVRSLAPTPQP
ncbi:MAG: hypothetical protein SWY16_22365 [Cyanobacteriota bacterium]|nr:hypothetical protein [Cyanobacteriota bacterium]